MHEVLQAKRVGQQLAGSFSMLMGCEEKPRLLFHKLICVCVEILETIVYEKKWALHGKSVKCSMVLLTTHNGDSEQSALGAPVEQFSVWVVLCGCLANLMKSTHSIVKAMMV